MTKPLVTVSIPTYNSTTTLARCLEAIKKQTYKNIEINIVDKNSTDQTIKIAEEMGVKKIKKVEGSLLRARYEGVKDVRGKYILILDSDQILEKDSIQRAVNLAKKGNYKMLVFEEMVYKADSFIEKLFQLDRKLINSVCNLSPFTGVIMPRFFDTNLIKKAYKNIPKSLFVNTGGPDHAIVYYESWKIDNNVGVVPVAVKHLEPTALSQLLPKFYRWGYTSVDAHNKKYKKLMNQKERFRTGLFYNGLFIESLGSILLLIIKGVAFKTGYYHAEFDKFFNFKRRY